ncbi:hypothetical protein BC939DRAFT_291996 [Gamsiella multidivaricata]|uniref:uncharacterized protein n=1 Tax=Gamsiella multidivaricata TaxID=101098 RepID=UPI0022200323|nr:uncharacterized protein BC939DRAFT_291996 [Gamsiella multidivaricata]KAI7818438.1 hypothetical protein BC939DRAFT_291996 [Gamsiella multidivaricata]
MRACGKQERKLRYKNTSHWSHKPSFPLPLPSLFLSLLLSLARAGGFLLVDYEGGTYMCALFFFRSSTSYCNASRTTLTLSLRLRDHPQQVLDGTIYSEKKHDHPLL